MRDLDPLIGRAVAERTYLRPTYLHDSPAVVYLHPDSKASQQWFQVLDNAGVQVIYDRDTGKRLDEPPVRGKDFEYETWGRLAERVAYGNAILDTSHGNDFLELRDAIENAHTVMAGRHLQHGDGRQPTSHLLLFSNCSTAASAWSRYYLLLNGSGVGRSLTDKLLLVDWDAAPHVQCVLDRNHPDFRWDGEFLSAQEARHRFGLGERVHWHEVDDSREGWARALETWEMMAYEKRYSDDLLVLDFSHVRPEGAPIRGMQGRPSSGPRPTMAAFHKAAAGIGSGLPRWLATLYVEHYFSESVLVGGARRASGLVEKFWRDRDILDFIRIKMPIEYLGLSPEEITEYRKQNGPPATTPLWTSNHSIGVDEEFWWLLSLKRGMDGYATPIARQARRVYRTAIETAYVTGSGEPGFLNRHKLNVSRDNLEVLR